MNEMIHHILGTCGEAHVSMLNYNDINLALSPGQEFLNFLLEKLGLLNKISYFKEKDMKISIFCTVSDLDAIINIAEGSNTEIKQMPKAYFNQTQILPSIMPTIVGVEVTQDEFYRLTDANVFEKRVVL